MYCKHRIRILQGLVEGIVSENTPDVQKIVGWVVGTDIEKALRTVSTMEEEAGRIKTALSAAKHALSRCFLD
jgi:hypothetical protein